MRVLTARIRAQRFRMFDLLCSAAGLRLVAFGGVLAGMTLWEAFAPRRKLVARKTLRWTSNFGLVVLNSILMRFIAPAGGVGVAILAQSHGWGLLNQLSVPDWLRFVSAIIVLDFAIYVQHVLFHAIPLLWRLHMVHHADLDCDVSTGLRFHTLEILLSFGIKSLVIVLLGVSPLAVLTFEVLLNGTAMFNHSNVQLPLQLDKLLRLLVVTPDMHRVHHSVNREETNSNFGFNLPWWDFLFGTYRSQPTGGHYEMEIGLPQVRDSRAVSLPHMLVMPFAPSNQSTTSQNQLGSESNASAESNCVGDDVCQTVT